MDKLFFGNYFVFGLGGYPVADATLVVHRQNPLRMMIDEIFRQVNPNGYPVIEKLLLTHSLPWKPTQYLCLSAPIPAREFRLVQVLPETGATTRLLVVDARRNFRQASFPRKNRPSDETKK